MTQTLWLLGSAYVALGVLVLALNIRSGWPLWIRLACIALVSSLYFVTWQSLQDLRGWPAQVRLPPHFLYNASAVVEPDESSGTQGRVYMWVTPIVDDKPIGVPRAYLLPYSRALHTKMARAREAMHSGRLQVGDATESDNNPHSSAKSAFAQHRQTINLHNVPEPSLPEK